MASRQAYLALRAGQTSRNRLQWHYDTTLSHDMLYALYRPASEQQARTDPSLRQPVWSPDNPYAANRPPPRPKGNRYLVPNPSTDVPRVKEVVVSTMSKATLQNKHNFLPLLMAYHVITGEPLQSKHPGPYGPGGRGIQITRSTKKSASFKIRAGAPTGCKVVLKGDQALSFLDTLTTFVLPRLKTFNGVPLPPPSVPRQSSSSTSGVVAFGLPPEAMALWPQIESSLDNYPRLEGMNIYIITDAKGRGAQDKARLVASGFNVPFVKR